MSDDDDDAEPIDEEAVREALRAVKSADGPQLSDVLLLVRASLDKQAPIVPETLQNAVLAKWTTDGDFANGGADQFVWNNGCEMTRRVAGDFRAVGAVENADLLDRLANELEAYLAEIGSREAAPSGMPASKGDAVQRFLGYRKRVGGPFFRVPEPAEELPENLVEHAVEHAGELPDPDGPLPGFPQ